jgi:SAM-dependent methyltransferase
VTAVFGDSYADAYDALYSDKDYSRECDLVDEALATYAAGARRILDLGCGTGGHSLELAARGYEVMGVDRSEPMLARALVKARELGLDASFKLGDLRTLDLQERFDAVLMMFAVLGYQVDNADAVAALATARRHLRDDGILVFDVWYGPAVLSERPSTRVKTIPLEEGELIRTSSGTLDSRRQLCTVRYHLERRLDGVVMEEVDEEHEMRFFFPLELELLLERTGFSLVQLSAFPDLGREPTDETWNVVCVARGVATSAGSCS